MQLVNEFVVPRPVDEAWAVLTDVERIAPCMPGAQLTEVEGDVYRGTVRVKVGPVVARFSGQAEFRERDDDEHRAVLEARGKEATGKGIASATVTMLLTPDGDKTTVGVTTDLSISGRLAQFGQGTVSDISARMLGQFLTCLEERVLTDDTATQAAPADAEPVDLLRSAGAPVARRLVPFALVLVVVAIVLLVVLLN
ncbi:MAG: hypothetical protein GEV10_14075 [Streptosporangiales bacterium]|nr:hypothetical protein [Streptosporangiales bacterium]